MLVFGAAAEAVGTDRVQVSVPDGASAGDVLAAMAAAHPQLGFALPGARLAVNHRFVPPETRVSSHDELALIALVGGG